MMHGQQNVKSDLRNQDIAFNKHSFSKGILTGSPRLFSNSD
jgi:hypothetical protein